MNNQQSKTLYDVSPKELAEALAQALGTLLGQEHRVIVKSVDFSHAPMLGSQQIPISILVSKAHDNSLDEDIAGFLADRKS